MKNQTLSHAEKLYLENEEYNKKNQDRVEVKGNKAEAFKKKHGYSLTMSKLMEKYGCKTIEDYRLKRKEVKAAQPKKTKTVKAPKVVPVQGKRK